MGNSGQKSQTRISERELAEKTFRNVPRNPKDLFEKEIGYPDFFAQFYKEYMEMAQTIMNDAELLANVLGGRVLDGELLKKENVSLEDLKNCELAQLLRLETENELRFLSGAYQKTLGLTNEEELKALEKGVDFETYMRSAGDLEGYAIFSEKGGKVRIELLEEVEEEEDWHWELPPVIVVRCFKNLEREEKEELRKWRRKDGFEKVLKEKRIRMEEVEWESKYDENGNRLFRVIGEEEENNEKFHRLFGIRRLICGATRFYL